MLKDGMTYMHEHTTIDLSEVKNNEDCKLDVFSETVREFKSLKGRTQYCGCHEYWNGEKYYIRSKSSRRNRH